MFFLLIFQVEVDVEVEGGNGDSAFFSPSVSLLFVYVKEAAICFVLFCIKRASSTSSRAANRSKRGFVIYFIKAQREREEIR